MLESIEYRHLATYFETGEWGLEIGNTHLHYCLYDDKVQVIREFRVSDDYRPYQTDDMSVHTFPYKNATGDAREALNAFLKEFLINVVRSGAPFYVSSDVYSSEEWEEFRLWFIEYQQAKNKKETI